MWAIVEIGKKQYKVTKGETLPVEKLKAGKTVTFDKVLLLVGDKKTDIGTPYVQGAKVKAEIVEEKKSPKVVIYKYKRRKKYRRTQGHRQIQTFLKISDITYSKK